MAPEWLKQQMARSEALATLQRKLKQGSANGEEMGGDGLVHDLGGFDSQAYAMKTGDGWTEPVAGHVTVVQQPDGTFGIVGGRESQIVVVDADKAKNFLAPGQAVDVRNALKEERRKLAERKREAREKKKSVG